MSKLYFLLQDVFHERVKVYQIWQHAQLMLTKKRELKSKFELQERRDKIAQAADEVTEWVTKVGRGQEEFDNISEMIKKEMERFEINRVKDFKNVIIQYLETIMNQQQEVIFTAFKKNYSRSEAYYVKIYFMLVLLLDYQALGRLFTGS